MSSPESPPGTLGYKVDRYINIAQSVQIAAMAAIQQCVLCHIGVCVYACVPAIHA